MLDLSKFTQNYYSIKLADKTILKLKKPTQKMLKTMIEFQNVDDLDETEVFDILYDLMTEIFNRNINNITFTRTEIEDMLPVDIAVIVLQDFLENTLSDLKK